MLTIQTCQLFVNIYLLLDIVLLRFNLQSPTLAVVKLGSNSNLDLPTKIHYTTLSQNTLCELFFAQFAFTQVYAYFYGIPSMHVFLREVPGSIYRSSLLYFHVLYQIVFDT